MKCEKCGKEFEEELKFCSNCGNNLQSGGTVEEEKILEMSTESAFELLEYSSNKKIKTRKLLTYSLLAAFVLFLVLMYALTCKHEYRPATCSDPMICSLCGKEKGDALGHDWIDATCINPKTCRSCREKIGDSLGHDWNDATCIKPKSCKRCDETEGRPLGHKVKDWSVVKKSTCSEEGTRKGTCKECGDVIEESVKLIDHVFGEFKITKKATCKEKGVKKQVCTVCGYEQEEEIKLAEHSYGDWKIVKTATIDSKGKKTKTCTVCNYIYETEYEISEDEYKAECVEYSYEEIARNPNSYKGKLGVFYGKVIQVIETNIAGYTSYTLRVAIDGDYDSVFLVSYFADKNEDHILEDDYVTMYGSIQGTKSYETVMGNSITIPYLEAEIIVIE